MSLGKQIRKYRKQAGLTQAQLADRLGITFQSVSSWENDEYLPDLTRLTEISRHLGVGINQLLEENDLSDLERRDRLSDEQHMYTLVKTALRLREFPLAYRALGYVDEITGKKTNLSRRALHLTCHALALGIETDEVLEFLLYYGLSQDTEVVINSLPASPACKEMLRLLSKKTGLPETAHVASLARCMNSVFELSTVAIDGDRAKMILTVQEAEKHTLRDLRALKNSMPEWNNAVYLMRYQLLSLIETYKRLL